MGIGPSKYANAVLRKVSTRSLEQWIPIVAPDPADDPIGHLAVAHSHPGGSSPRSATPSAGTSRRRPPCWPPTTNGPG
nr:hypothetical protein GCM10020093_114360 [Planobispora longispora]